MWLSANLQCVQAGGSPSAFEAIGFEEWPYIDNGAPDNYVPAVGIWQFHQALLLSDDTLRARAGRAARVKRGAW